MIVSVFVRRLQDGRTYDDFVDAWYPETGFGVPTRVLNAVRVDDPAEILSLGFVDVSEDDLAVLSARIARAEAVRHERIADVIESTELRAVYRLVADEDFTARPKRFGQGKPGSGIVRST